MEINGPNNKLRWIYLAGFFIILALPLFNLPPWFYPTDWSKSIVFRSIMALLLFLFAYQLFFKRSKLDIPNVKKNKIVWALAALFLIFLLASVFSIDPRFSFWGSPYRGGGFVTFAFFFVFAILAFFLFRNDEDWKKFWDFSIIIGLAVSTIALCQFYGLLSKIFLTVGERPGSTIGNPIFLGIYLLLLFFLTLSFGIKEFVGGGRGKAKKIFYILSLLVFLYVILLTGSRASYLGVLAGILLFVFFFPRKIPALKIGLAAFLICIVLAVLYVNFASGFPAFLEKNRLFINLASRLSLEAVAREGRFAAWEIVIKEIKDRPILGWGPENLAVGFDRHYDPNITGSPWWDRAHNIFLQIGAEAGVLGILAYIFLFAALFWQLHNAKKTTDDQNKKITLTAIQATLLGYLVANFFSFDCFPTYLLFFFIISYTLLLTNTSNNQPSSAAINNKKPAAKRWRTPTTIFLLIILVVFLWRHNFVPFEINTKINIANDWANTQKKCNSALNLMEKLSEKHSIIDSYLRIEYVNNLRNCLAINPGKNLEYAKIGLPLLKEAVAIQPSYTRFWIYLGGFQTVIANYESDEEKRKAMIDEAYGYFDVAQKLSPRRTGTLTERAKANMVAKDYQDMKTNAEKCVSVNPDLGNCYWARALSKIYLQDFSGADADIKTAQEKGFDTMTIPSMLNLINAYAEAENYKKLIAVYQELIARDPVTAQYHASLAFAYSKVGEYKKAREEAMRFLELMPEAKEEVEAFLRMLPLN